MCSMFLAQECKFIDQDVFKAKREEFTPRPPPSIPPAIGTQYYHHPHFHHQQTINAQLVAKHYIGEPVMRTYCTSPFDVGSRLRTDVVQSEHTMNAMCKQLVDAPSLDVTYWVTSP